ncbi:MAG: hypothetical protein ACFCGT_27970 [Sandaracinaceae bacterium]
MLRPAALVPWLRRPSAPHCTGRAPTCSGIHATLPSRLRAPAALGATLLGLALAGCGAGPYGYAKTYQPYGEEGRYLQRAVDLSYQDLRRFPDRFGDALVGWFGIVQEIEPLDDEGRARVRLEYRTHQERHLCADETGGSCRVTVSARAVGPFIADLTIRPEHRQDNRDRMHQGSLLRVYGTIAEQGTEESGPTLATEWYRHWPVGTYVTTGSAGNMRR